ncbi:MAG TPA: ribonuclease E/G, partial [Clostridia bacterium]|nr:ribonuclease E/G [Clostridia bacterium]
MDKQIIIEKHPYRTRVVLIEDSEIAEYLVQTKAERLVGNIYKGKVQNILPGMNAAFIDIGLEKNAFLQLDDVPGENIDTDFDGLVLPKLSIKNTLRPGQEIMVQVQKEPSGTKGARVTANISVAGRCVVLMPAVNIVGISRRIEDEAERERLKGIAGKIKHPDMGIIIRTSAAG